MEESVKKIAITLSETAQWHALLGRAEYLLEHCLPEEVTHYLVRLFLNITREDMGLENILMNVGEEISDADEKLQRVADRCLMIGGFYPDIANIHDMTEDELIQMGRNAYRALAKNTDMETAAVYTYLDRNFDRVVDMLNRILHLSPVNSQFSSGMKRGAPNSKETDRTLGSRQLN